MRSSTGALGFDEMAEHLITETNIVRYLPIPPDQMAAAMRVTGASDFAIDTALAHLEYWRTGLGAEVTHVAQQLLGRPPRTFATFAADHSAVFTGAPAQRPSGDRSAHHHDTGQADNSAGAGTAGRRSRSSRR